MNLGKQEAFDPSEVFFVVRHEREVVLHGCGCDEEIKIFHSLSRML